jgi:UDP-N-acetylmuramate--alanine ligase
VLSSGKKNVHFIPDREELKRTVGSNLMSGDILMTLGAGDIWKLGEELMKEMETDR